MADKKVTAADTTADPKQFLTSAEMASYNDYMDTKAERAQRAAAESHPKKRGYKKGGKVSSASSRADGIASRGKTRGTIVRMG